MQELTDLFVKFREARYGPVTSDWNQDDITFVCEEALVLDINNACFVDSCLWQCRFSEAELDVVIAKLCQRSRGRLAPCMFPLFAPRVGPRNDFSVFLFPVHRNMPHMPESNHWSLLVLYYEQQLALHGGEGTVEFWHYDSLTEQEGGNQKCAYDCAQLIHSYLLFDRRNRQLSTLPIVREPKQGDWPKQSDRSCGLRACVTAALVAKRVRELGSALSEVHPLECINSENFHLATQAIIARSKRVLREMSTFAWKQESPHTRELFRRWLLNFHAESTLSLDFGSLDRVRQAIEWHADATETLRVFFDNDTAGEFVGHWSSLDARVDIYCLEQTPRVTQLLDSFIQTCTRQHVIVCVHALQNSTTPFDGQSLSLAARACWFYRVTEYLIRTGRRGLMLSTSNALALVADIPRHAPQTYAASRATMNLSFEETILGQSSKGTLVRIPFLRVPDAVNPTTLCIISMAGPNICFRLDSLNEIWYNNYPSIIAHRMVRAYLPGIDYKLTLPIGKFLFFHHRLGVWAHQRLWLFTSSLSPTLTSTVGIPQACWHSAEWISCLLSYLIHVHVPLPSSPQTNNVEEFT